MDLVNAKYGGFNEPTFGYKFLREKPQAQSPHSTHQDTR
jgi:hypothetical protein